ncbi:hypothetical protein PHJA_001155000 [Phtheirospermum japonicum]|uniref:Enhancer of polycomb-like protein n=1 Tax=Phtheirospermum japonicum TaxID=374723 RepID=A0A830BVU8_9LAMI|nr:hypothetical protein PHJA_001155000 [Phtheirospermum japonicum]
MPSVGMRRSTRVFGARVLRSGRRLWTEPHEGSKNVRSDHAENQWTDLLEHSGNVCKETRHENESNASEDVKMEECALEGDDVEVKDVDKMYGIVYRRKRKRSESGKTGPMEDRRFAKKFYRKQWRKKSKIASFETCRDSVCRFRDLAVVVNGLPCEYGYWMTCFLTTVLSYMAKVRIGVRRLSKFLLLEPIFGAYSSHGVLFLQDSTTAKNPCICIISGSKSLIPLFSINFSAIPSFYVNMQTTMYLRSSHLSCMLVAHSLDIYEKDADKSYETNSAEMIVRDVADNSEEHSIQIPSYIEPQDFITLESCVHSGRKDFSHTSLGVNKSSLRSFQSRNSRSIQKRRSSMRRKRGRPFTSFRAQKASGTLAADFFRIRQENLIQFSNKNRPAAKNVREQKCTSSSNDVFATGCSVNLLITETDKCYREEGANITLEMSAEKQWFLAVTKAGVKKYRLSAEKVMRPCCTNRFSHATIWTVDGGSKLEFYNKQDWSTFKELYKKCYDRNMLSHAASVIPVPGVQEVYSPVNMNYKPYVRPDSYINVRDDELTRALVKNSANYDMDSDDEAWLAELNDELCVAETVTHDSFELIIDAFEKGSHCNPDEGFDDRAVFDFCVHLERREVIEAVHSYWVKKRKQKRAALVRIFQLYQPRRIQVIPKSIFRKKRSFKRQANHHVGRGKQRPVLHAIAAERDTLEQQNNVQKLQEAKAAAGRFEGLAILKRQKAQMLMANADLATYKALMALRIAEAAQIAEAPEKVQSFFPG